MTLRILLHIDPDGEAGVTITDREPTFLPGHYDPNPVVTERYFSDYPLPEGYFDEHTPFTGVDEARFEEARQIARKWNEEAWIGRDDILMDAAYEAHFGFHYIRTESSLY